MINVMPIEYPTGWEAAVRGMRNPLNSWSKSDSHYTTATTLYAFAVGPNDLDLMQRLYKSGTEHRKFLRMIHVQMDISAPLYWWKEFDTYKIGTTANSCSTMHKIADHEFTLMDFSTEHLFDSNNNQLQLIGLKGYGTYSPLDILGKWVIPMLNQARDEYLRTKDKEVWWQMIQLLPSSYNQLRTVDMNYENVMTIIDQRSNHKLDEWRKLVDILRSLPYVKEIRGEAED